MKPNPANHEVSCNCTKNILKTASEASFSENIQADCLNHRNDDGLFSNTNIETASQAKILHLFVNICMTM